MFLDRTGAIVLGACARLGTQNLLRRCEFDCQRRVGTARPGRFISDMSGLYLFTAIVGWAFVAIFVFFGGDADMDLDADIDFDADVDLDMDLESSFWADFAGDYLSVRGLIFFLAGFGLTGLVIDTILGTTAIVAFVLAVLMGILAMFISGRLKRAVKQNMADSNLRLSDLRGAAGQVVLPMSADSRGRIAVEVAGKKRYMVARPYRNSPALGVGDKVVVIEVDGSTALVAPNDASAS